MANTGKFLMICYVAADFGPVDGMKFRIGPSDRGSFIEAPEWIKDTLMYKWLLKDGSIKVADAQISKTQGENDPMAGMSAEGKSIKATEAAAEARENATVDDLINPRKPAKADEAEQPEGKPEGDKKAEEPAQEKPAKATKAKAKSTKGEKGDKAVDEK